VRWRTSIGKCQPQESEQLHNPLYDTLRYRASESHSYCRPGLGRRKEADAASITLQIVRKAPNAEATVEKGRELTKAKVQPRTPEIVFRGPSIKILEIPVTNERGGRRRLSISPVRWWYHVGQRIPCRAIRKSQNTAE